MFGKKNILKWSIAAVVLLLIFNLPDGYTVRFNGFFNDLLTPLHGFFLKSGRSLKAGVDSVRGFSGLAEENRRLYQEVIALQAESRVRDTLETENLRLSELLEFRNQQTIELIPAQVVMRSISGWWQSVRIGKGTRSGVHKDQAVISPDGLVGRTTSASLYSAEVLLVADPACKVSARVSRTGSFGLVVGKGVSHKGYPVAQMQFIHKDTPVRVGDDVVTSGLGGVFPKDVLIGRIEEIHTDDAGLYQIAEILPQAVANLTDVVFITAVKKEEGE